MNPLLEQMTAHADPAQVAGLSRFFKTGPGQYGEGDKFLVDLSCYPLLGE